jgi:hypothetical protein
MHLADQVSLLRSHKFKINLKQKSLSNTEAFSMVAGE